jgi:hypothetical protein
MHEAAREVMAALVAVDDGRARTKQRGPGMSSIGGCARKLYHLIRLDEPCNETERLAAILGTAIHKALEAAPIEGEKEVPLLIEEVDLPGTADLIRDNTITDFKTSTLRSIEWVKEHGPSRDYRWQLALYGYAARAKGYEIERLRLVFVPRDGKSTDIYVFETPYDEAVARQAIEWYQGIQDDVYMDHPPEPGKDAAFCAKYCQFFGELCPGKTEIQKNEPELDDPWAASAAADYAEGIALEKRAKALKERAKGALEGVRGVVGGYRVGWVQRKPGEALDADAIRADYAARGERVPMKTTAGAEYPSVRAVKAARSDAD